MNQVSIPLYDGLIDIARQVVTNNPPYAPDLTYTFSLDYAVGEALWANFPIFDDIEFDVQSPYSLVTFDYLEGSTRPDRMRPAS